MPFTRMKRLTEKGVIPRKFRSMIPPLCPWCIFGRQHRKLWQSTKTKVLIWREAKVAPGVCVLTDQLVSSQGGLMPRRTGKLMNARYVEATIFVDHYSDYVYAHLMRDWTAEATMEAKNAWQQLAGIYAEQIQ